VETVTRLIDALVKFQPENMNGMKALDQLSREVNQAVERSNTGMDTLKHQKDTAKIPTTTQSGRVKAVLNPKEEQQSR
jgi:hypothetical protein